MNISLQVLPKIYAMLKLANSADISQEIYESDFYVVSESKDEISVICEQDLVPDSHTGMSGGWKLLKFTGSLDDGLVGVVAHIAKPLADAGISIIVHTTYDAGYFGVSNEELSNTIEVLNAAGIETA
jgi:hypothetical protein